MAKTTKIIPGGILASVLSIPAVTLAHHAGSLAGNQVLAAPVQAQRANYHDGASATSGFPMTFNAAMARVQAQQWAFELYGGTRSSSATRSTAPLASDQRV